MLFSAYLGEKKKPHQDSPCYKSFEFSLTSEIE